MEDLQKEVCNTPTDIPENEILASSPELLAMLLVDNTTHKNILWATDNYAHLGAGYQFNDSIQIEAITGKNGNIIVPRSLKNRQQQQRRSREMAEVFTPAWVCNLQNNLVDGAWFGRDGVFNVEDNDNHTWIVNTDKITFPEGKTWMDYVGDTRLEITCGEAPYLASRYDAVTGKHIPIEQRIGILDRKLRVVSENCQTPEEWLNAAKVALQNSYGYEWQGDNILLARESLLYTFIDYYKHKFQATPDLDTLKQCAEIISWNIWQMDGLKGVIPNSCTKTPKPVKAQPSLFDAFEEEMPDYEPTLLDCPGCKKKGLQGFHLHTGIYCDIMDWGQHRPIKFSSLLKTKQ
jgi:hypothetical protein